nr:hypothetical protein [Bacillota bacterium]
TLQPGQTYTVVIIDYVYLWYQLDSVRSDADIQTGLYIRDVLIEDVRTKGLDGELFSPISHPEASLEQLVTYDLSGSLWIPIWIPEDIHF